MWLLQILLREAFFGESLAIEISIKLIYSGDILHALDSLGVCGGVQCDRTPHITKTVKARNKINCIEEGILEGGTLSANMLSKKHRLESTIGKSGEHFWLSYVLCEFLETDSSSKANQFYQGHILQSIYVIKSHH